MRRIEFKDLVWLTVLVGCLWALQEINTTTIRKLEHQVNILRANLRYSSPTLTIYEP